MLSRQRVIESTPNYDVVEVGGEVWYSFEFSVYLATLEPAERRRIVAEIEERNRRRRIVRRHFAAPKFFKGGPDGKTTR